MNTTDIQSVIARQLIDCCLEERSDDRSVYESHGAFRALSYTFAVAALTEVSHHELESAALSIRQRVGLMTMPELRMWAAKGGLYTNPELAKELKGIARATVTAARKRRNAA